MTTSEFETICGDYVKVLTRTEPGDPEQDEIIIAAGAIFHEATQQAIKAGITQDQIKKIIKHSFDKLYT